MIPPDFRAYAHRGGSREAPENSLTAFRHAVCVGFLHLETDVRPTRDGVAVLHHDATLDRTTDGRGPVRDLLWRDLAHVHHSDGTTPLRLEELLEALPGTHITVDAKEEASVLAIADAVRRTGCHDRICIASFSPARLARLRALLPGVESGAHPGEVIRLRAGVGSLPRASRVQVPARAFGVDLATSSFIDRARARGLSVDVWTVDDPAEMSRLLDLGVDGIMTDSPSILRDVLDNR
ncbi:MAG: hypothetical protein RL347_1887 [Actinomycetota bacterium]|jgi:glycerophosphoryl diester phosphodiesterase